MFSVFYGDCGCGFGLMLFAVADLLVVAVLFTACRWGEFALGAVGWFCFVVCLF